MFRTVKASLALAAGAMLWMAAPVMAQQEQMMSNKPSECEVFAALSGDSSCEAEPSARGLSVEGDTQGLAISTDSGQDAGAATTTTTTTKKKSTKTAATSSTKKVVSNEPKAAAFQSIQFEFNSDALTSDARGTLDTVASVLQEPYFEKSKFIIEGHTDSVGSAAYNKELSDRRAQAVVDYLTQRGVAADKLTARGMGESDPYDPANPGAGVNRRVVVLNLGG